MRIRYIAVLLFATLVLCTTVYMRPFRFIDNIFYDLNFALASKGAPADSVVVVAIDEISISQLGAMPWPRSTLARLFELIESASPRAVAPDLLFPKRPEEKQTDSLAAVFSRMKCLVLPFSATNFSDDSNNRELPEDVFNHRFLMMTQVAMLESASFFTASATSGSEPVLTETADYRGFLNVTTSTTSQVLRESIHVIRMGQDYYPSFGVASAAAFFQLRPDQIVLDGAPGVHLGGRFIPLTSYAGSFFINYRKNKQPLEVISASELIGNNTDLLKLRDKLVFVGVTDPGASSDFFITPIGNQYPGVFVWANTALDIIHNSWIRYGGGWLEAINWLILLLIFPGMLLFFAPNMRLYSIVCMLVIMTGSVVAGIILLQQVHYFWNPVPHIHAFLFSLIGLAVQKVEFQSSQALSLDPPDSSADTLPPPNERDFLRPLSPTKTVKFAMSFCGIDTAALALVSTERSSAEGNHSTTPSVISAVELEKIRKIAGAKILGCIGSGGMADVYLAWNPTMEVYRAIKVLKPDLPGNNLNRFETEIKIISKFDHPNIVHCYGVAVWHSMPYIEMEFVNGTSMDKVMRTCKLLTVEQALCIGVLLCRALHYAHNQVVTMYGKSYRGIIHRDIKPANIILSKSGKIKLTDFGISRPGTVSINTGDNGKIVGTLPYLAPEQFNEDTVSVQSDIYSVGATLFEFLTGEKAFPQREIAPLLSAKAQGRYKKIVPSKQISREIVDILNKALAQKPEDRYSSAAVMQEELQRVLMERVEQNAYEHLGDLVSRISGS